MKKIPKIHFLMIFCEKIHIFQLLSKKPDTCFFAALACFFIPDGGLNLAYVSRSHHKHAESRLPDTASDGKRQLTAEKHLVEWKGSSVLASGEAELAHKALFVNSYAH